MENAVKVVLGSTFKNDQKNQGIVLALSNSCYYYNYYYTLYSLPVFSSAKSLQLILEISATYRFISYLLADN